MNQKKTENNSVTDWGVKYFNGLYFANKRNLSWDVLKKAKNSTNKRRKQKLLEQFLVDWHNAS